MLATIHNQQTQIQWECQNIAQRIRQNLQNLLNTHTFEVPYDRRRGLTGEVYDLPFSLVKANIRAEVERVLSREQNFTLQSVECALVDGGLYIECQVEIEDDPRDRPRINL